MRRRVFVILLAAAAIGAGTAHAAPKRAAVFVQTNNPAGNQIVAYTRNADGTLTLARTYATGGNGGVESGAVVDSLASQGSLTYDAEHQLLFAVNAGSDSLSVFGVDGSTLSLRQVIASGGSFPTSVAVSGDLLYALNAGGDGTVQGFRIVGSQLRALHDGSRTLGLGNTTPPFFLSSPGQVGFSPDGSQLIVTTKGSTNSIDVFAVRANGSLSDAPVANAAATPAPFAFTFDPAGRLVVAEAGINTVSTYTLAGDGTLSGAQSQPDGQAALCWITGEGGNFYVANAGSATISGYRIEANGTPTLIGVVGHTEAGAIDMAASSDQQFLYAESGGAGTVDEFQVNSDGTLTKLGIVGGLPAGLEGIAST
jgi:6-phosphogluconolactonase (cycloisomerase 2 family)